MAGSPRGRRHPRPIAAGRLAARGAGIALLAGLVGCAWAAPAAAQGQPVPVAPDQAYTQAASGMVFPPAVGDFQRIGVERYDDVGADESAGYDLATAAGLAIVVTVYVYPAAEVGPLDVAAARARACTAEFDAIESQITTFYADATLQRDGPAKHAGLVGFGASYTLTAPNFGGAHNVAARSEAYLFCYVGGRWLVEYRVTYPATLDARAQIDGFMRDLAWTIPSQP